jgi:hypothetical protein
MITPDLEQSDHITSKEQQKESTFQIEKEIIVKESRFHIEKEIIAFSLPSILSMVASTG